MPPVPSIPPALPQLVAWLAEHTQGDLAGPLEIQQSAVSLWARGLSRPGGYLREATEIVTGIPAHDWNTAEENKLLDRVRKRMKAARRKPRAATTAEHPAARGGARRADDEDRPSWTGTEG